MNYQSSEKNPNHGFDDLRLQLTDQMLNDIAETGKWARFLAIVSFIVLGLVLIGMVIMGGSLLTVGAIAGYDTLPILIAYGVGIAIAIMPTLFLYRFGQYTRGALDSFDNMALTLAFSNLRSLFRFYAVVTIISIGLYGFAFVIGLLAFGLMS